MPPAFAADATQPQPPLADREGPTELAAADDAANRIVDAAMRPTVL